MVNKKNCAKCGTKTYVTSIGMIWCPNCGKLVENQDDADIVYYEKEVTPKYVG
jgi:uncharacterized Zn finger protein (UPF0148 family)